MISVRIPHVFARFKLKGIKAEVGGVALIDTGSSFTILDKDLANGVGVEYIERVEKVELRGICCIAGGTIANLKHIEIKDKPVGSTSVIAAKLSNKVREALCNLSVRDDIILDMADLVRTGYIIDLKEGKLKYVGILCL